MLQVYKWLKTQDPRTTDFGELASRRHAEMAPSSGQGSQISSSRRPEPKAKFCQTVAEKGLAIANTLVRDKRWRDILNQVEESLVRQSLSEKPEPMMPLFEIVERILNLLKKFPNTSSKDKYDPFLVFTIDEASSLLILGEGGDVKTGLYVAMNRILSCLKESPIWFFFLSTESKAESLVPANEMSLKGSDGVSLWG